MHCGIHAVKILEDSILFPAGPADLPPVAPRRGFPNDEYCFVAQPLFPLIGAVSSHVPIVCRWCHFLIPYFLGKPVTLLRLLFNRLKKTKISNRIHQFYVRRGVLRCCRGAGDCWELARLCAYRARARRVLSVRAAQPGLGIEQPVQPTSPAAHHRPNERPRPKCCQIGFEFIFDWLWPKIDRASL